MNDHTSPRSDAASPRENRRQFTQKVSAGLATAAGLSTAIDVSRMAHAAGDDTIRIGLVGCGGRGTGAAAQALRADPHVRLVALGDAFADRIDSCVQSLSRREEFKDKVDVPAERRFAGFDAYKNVLASDIQVVLLATPPHFRPIHMQAAVDAGVHIFAEKPVGVDAPGIRSVLQTCQLAASKNLSVVSGLCLRHSLAFQELMKRVHDGAIGEVHTLQANDYRGGIWVKPREPEWTDMHWQLRNWYYFTWLSGDFNVEQHVHFLDICAWAMQDQYPTQAIGMGGRQVRTEAMYGNIYDHHSVTYEYANGAKLYSNTRQWPDCRNDMSAQLVGTRGRANISETRGKVWIETQTNNSVQRWTYDGPDNDVYQTEHDVLFASIRNGKPINNGTYMSYSTLLAILGRMATYTGQLVKWEQALNSKEDLSPPTYAWGPLATPPIAYPGRTKVV